MSQISRILEKYNFTSWHIDFSDSAVYKDAPVGGFTFADASDSIIPQIGSVSGFNGNNTNFTQSDSYYYRSLLDGSQFKLNLGTVSLVDKSLFYVYRLPKYENFRPLSGSITDVVIEDEFNTHLGNYTFPYNVVNNQIEFDSVSVIDTPRSVTFVVTLTIQIRSNDGNIVVTASSGTVSNPQITVVYDGIYLQDVLFSWDWDDGSVVHSYTNVSSFQIDSAYRHYPLFLGYDVYSDDFLMRVSFVENQDSQIEIYERGNGGNIFTYDSYDAIDDGSTWRVLSYRINSSLNELVFNGSQRANSSQIVRTYAPPTISTTYSLVFNDTPKTYGITNDPFYVRSQRLDVGEIILCSGYLSNSDFYDIDSYLNKKWALRSLPPSLPQFVSIWQANSPIELPLTPNGIYSGIIDWGDGYQSALSYEARRHTYATSGTYTVTITGQIQGWDFQNYGSGYNGQILEVKSFGSLRGGTNSNAGLFHNCDNLTMNSVSDTLNLVGVTDLSLMFNGCSSLNEINRINEWDVSSVTTMGGLFRNSAFNDDISSWNVSNVTDMQGMFRGSQFNNYINSWDVSNVTNMQGMFSYNSSFNQDINSWDVSSVLDMSLMFEGSSLFNQDINSWDVSNVQNMTSMFTDSIFNGDISSWTVSNVTSMNGMFTNNSVFNQDISSWDVSSVVEMTSMFEGASLFNQDINSWDVSSVLDMQNMFKSSGITYSLNSWNVSNVQYMVNMFADSNFNGDISSWTVSSVLDMTQMFKGTPFDQDISGWNVSNVQSMQGMFSYNSSFNQDIDSWDVSSVLNMKSMFQYAGAFNKSLPSWDVSGVGDMDYMFMGASAFNGDISTWTTTSLNTMTQMFSGAVSFNQDIGNWDVSGVNYMQETFAEATAFNRDLSNWDIRYVITMQDFMRSKTNADFDIIYYDNMLASWSLLPLQNSVNAGFGLMKHSGDSGFENLVGSYSWSIDDGGKTGVVFDVTNTTGSTVSFVYETYIGGTAYGTYSFSPFEGPVPLVFYSSVQTYPPGIVAVKTNGVI